MKKPYPKFDSDDAEQTFLDTADLSEYDLETGFRPFDEWLADAEAARKDARVNLRLPKALIEAYRAKAEARGVPYQRLMRLELQRAIRKAS